MRVPGTLTIDLGGSHPGGGGGGGAEQIEKHSVVDVAECFKEVTDVIWCWACHDLVRFLRVKGTKATAGNPPGLSSLCTEKDQP